MKYQITIKRKAGNILLKPKLTIQDAAWWQKRIQQLGTSSTVKVANFTGYRKPVTG